MSIDPGGDTVPTDYPWTHVRADWESPAEPVKGPAPFPWATADRIAIHYTAANNLIDGDPGENWAGIPAYLRAIQHDYLTNPERGYSIGYGVAVDQSGETWQLRGADWRNAANLNWNHRTFTILVLVDGADALRPPAVEAVRSLVAWFRSQSPFDMVPIVGHRDIGATACPGNGVYAQIVAGELEPRPPVPEPEPPEDEMAKPELRRVAGSTATLIIDGATAVWVKKGDAIAPALADGLIVDKRIGTEGGSDIPALALGVLTLLGPIGDYSTEPGRDIRITAAHFAGQIL